MAVIYLPQDQRTAAWGQAIGNVAEAYDTQQRTKEVQGLMAGGETDPAKLSAAAGSNPKAQGLVKQYVEQQELRQKMQLQGAQAVTEAFKQKKEQADATKALADAQLVPLRMKEQEALARLHEAQAKGIPAEIDKWTAETQHLQAQSKLLEVQSKQSEFFIKFLGGSLGQDEPQAVGGITPAAGEGTPTGGVGKPASPISGAPEGTDLQNDPLSNSIKGLEKYVQTPLGRGIGVAVHDGTGKLSATQNPGTALTPQETETVGDYLSLSQSLLAFQKAIRRDKDGNLVMGPIGGRLQGIIDRFKKDPSKLDDNILIDTLTGHLELAGFKALGGSRPGFNMANLIGAILASQDKGKAFDMYALENSARLVRNSLGALSEGFQTGKHIGIPLSTLKQIEATTREIMNYDPTNEKSGFATKTKDGGYEIRLEKGKKIEVSHEELQHTAEKYNLSEKDVLIKLHSIGTQGSATKGEE